MSTDDCQSEIINAASSSLRFSIYTNELVIQLAVYFLFIFELAYLLGSALFTQTHTHWVFGFIIWIKWTRPTADVAALWDVHGDWAQYLVEGFC